MKLEEMPAKEMTKKAFAHKKRTCLFVFYCSCFGKNSR